MDVDIRAADADDAAELAELLNQIIDRGGTTALEEPFSPEALSAHYLTGPDVISCFVAVDRVSGRLEGFQTLGHLSELPPDVGDIGTFVRLGESQRGVGSALFAATRAEAVRQGLSAITATIRADNEGGLAFYSRMGFVDCGVRAAAPLRDGTLIDRIHKVHALGRG